MDEQLKNTIREQITAIRDSGLTNMFDIGKVYVIASQCNYKELTKFIEKNASTYARIIMNGDF